MLSKEQGIAVLGILAAYDVLFSWHGLDIFLGLGSRSFFRIPWRETRSFILRQFVLFAGGAALMFFRFHIMNWTQPIHSIDQNPAAFHPVFFHRVLTYAYMQARHLWLLIFPWPMCIVWSGRVHPQTNGWL